jgi:hypothetical protein
MSEEEKNKGSWLEDEPPPSPEEIAAASTLAEKVDGLRSGRLPEDKDALFSTAMMIRSSEIETSISRNEQDTIVRRALTQASADTRALKVRRWAPAFALAASLLLVIGSSILLLQVKPRETESPNPMLMSQVLSRPSDDLLGKPISDRAGASQRLDLVFADRLSGYRQVMLGEGRLP